MTATLKSLLAGDRVLRLFALGQLCDPKLVEMVGHLGGFDAVWFDQEHTGLTIRQVEESARAARSVGLPCFVRLPATDYATVMRVLEAGAEGLMASMVRRHEEVEELVRWGKFHPIGMRGVNGSGVDGRYGLTSGADYFVRANAETVLGVQIEHVEAVEVVDRIAAQPHLDFLFIGPADLSQSLGIPAQWEHPRLWQCIERVAKACAANRRRWAILPLSPAFGRRCVDLGCSMLSIGFDVWCFARGVRAFQADYAELS